MTSVMVGREAELTELAAALQQLAHGRVTVVLDGPPGIGKSTLWGAAVEAAEGRGYRVLSCRPVEAETQFPHSALGDLLGQVADEVLPSLPDPQRRALEVALLKADAESSPSEQRVVSVAVLGALRSLLDGGPVLLAVDDVQWLDVASARVLAFAVRRLEGERLGLLATMRSEEGDRDLLDLTRLADGSALQRISVGPLPREDLDAVLRSRLRVGFPKPIMDQLHRESGGNPLYAIEIGRALDHAASRVRAGRPLPIPESLSELVQDRIAAVPTEGREALLVVAALGEPSRELVTSVLQPDRVAGLDAAIDSRLLVEDRGRLRFSHPLQASIVLADAGPSTLAALHRRLADHVTDPLERARHLSLGTVGSDPGIALALDAAARLARDRGAPDMGAELAEDAIRVTPEGQAEDIRRRQTAAADLHFEAGDPVRARELLDQFLVTVPPGPDRADALRRLARIRQHEESYPAAVELFHEALEETGDDLELRARIRRDLAWTELMSGDVNQAAVNARAALELAEGLEDPQLLAEALAAVGLAQAMLGRGMSSRLLARSRSLEQRSEQLGLEPHPDSSVGLALKFVDDVDAARDELELQYRHALDRGDERSLPLLLWHLSELECRAGRWELADRYADQGLAGTLRTRQDPVRGGLLFAKALLLAHRGQVGEARARAEEGMAAGERSGASLVVFHNLSVLGFIELSLHNPEGADRYMGPLADLVLARGLFEPVVARFLADEIEALASMGELDKARLLIERLEERGRTLERVWALATAARCRGLLAASQGDLPEAIKALDEALTHHARLPYPFARGRTLLILGEVQRRAKQKRVARDTLQQALDIFERLGAAQWAERVSTEMRRIGGRAPSSGDLTPTESQVADLVALGRTNREVAERLFMAVKTVDANLSRIFHKLQVRSRTALAIEWARRKEAERDAEREERAREGSYR